MEGKSVILGVLIMSLFMVQIQVEAIVCCPSPVCRLTYGLCEGPIVPKSWCLSTSGCIEVDTCPSNYPYGNLENRGNDVKGFCKLGCMSSMCGAMTTLQNSDAASEIVNESCAKACATFCNKDSLTTAAETA